MQVSRTLKVFVGTPSGERLLLATHASIPMDLTHAEIISRFGLQPHMSAVLEYNDGQRSFVLRGADQPN